MKNILLIAIFFLSGVVSQAQRLKSSEKSIISDIKSTVYFLADDKLEGRRTGTEGEKLAANYIVNKFKDAGLIPKGNNGTYIQDFTVNEGRQVLPATFLTLNADSINSDDYFPLTFSADGSFSGMISPAIHEADAPWFSDIHELLSENVSNPHFELENALKTNAETFHSKGATAVIFYSSGAHDPELKFDGKSKKDRLSIPVIFVNKKASTKYISSKQDFIKISTTLQTGEKVRTGHNVIGYIDNGAPNTIVIGGHYDHLGYGQDHNSLWTGPRAIHNGADDNASGTALVIETAKLLKKSKFKNNNYLFICFSGEELGLFGSKYFTEHPTVPLETINFMINSDMVGRLNETTRTITIGGYGTSPEWSSLPQKTKYIEAKFDSSGIGPSDHTSFYLKNIPVLFFFTGTHPDYHKPSDDADKINYEGELRVIQYVMDVIKKVDKSGKIEFLKTREPDMGKSPKFTVTLGVMPDYTFSGKGLKIDGVISGKIAEKAGMKAGDVITRIGDYKVTDINDYMKALSHFKKGDKTSLEFLDGKATKNADIEF